MAKTALLSSRAVVKVGGADARAFLKGLLTADAPEPGKARFGALLTPQGKILFDMVMAAREGEVFLDCRAEAAEALVKRLTLYRLRAKATIERLPDWAVGVAVGGDFDADERDVLCFHDPRWLGLGQRLIGPRPAVERALRKGEPAREADYEALRIGLGAPEFGSDFGADEVFLLDVNYDALQGVDYKKGCFIGQEVTSRMKRKGEARRRVLRVSFEGAPPAKGAPVTAGASQLGAIMSGAEGVALALIRLDRLTAAQQAEAAIMADGQPLRIDIPAYLEDG